MTTRNACLAFTIVAAAMSPSAASFAQNTPGAARSPWNTNFQGFTIELGLGARFESSPSLTQNLGSYPGTFDLNTFFAFDAGFRMPMLAVGDFLGTGRATTIQVMGRFSVSSGGGDLLLGGTPTGHANVTQFDVMAGAQVRVPIDRSSFFNTGQASHELRFGAGYREPEPTTDVYAGVLGGMSYIGASGGPFPTVRFQGGEFAPAVRGIVGIQTPIAISPNYPIQFGIEYQVQYTGGVHFSSSFAGERFRLDSRVSHALMFVIAVPLQAPTPLPLPPPPP